MSLRKRPQLLLLLLLIVASSYLAVFMDGRWVSLGEMPKLLSSLVETFNPSPTTNTDPDKPLPVQALLDSFARLGDHGAGFGCNSSTATGIAPLQPGQIYRWTDAAGGTHFGDTAPDDVLAEVVDPGQQPLDYFSLTVSYPSGQVPADVRSAVEVGGRAIYKIYSELLTLPKMSKANLAVKVYGNERAYQQYRAQVAPDVPASVYGFYSWARNEAVVLHRRSIRETRETALHEATHVINARNFGKMPKWFNEGTAEYFENLVIRGQSATAQYDRAWLSGLGREYAVMPLHQLLSSRSEEWAQGLRPAYYANAWALTYFLMLPQNRGFMQSFQAALAEDKCIETDSLAFFSTAYPGGVAQLERDWRRWLKGPHRIPTSY